jgi:hypothetical protein
MNQWLTALKAEKRIPRRLGPVADGEKEMREPDKEVMIYSPRCCIHAKVIPRNSLFACAPVGGHSLEEY